MDSSLTRDMAMMPRPWLATSIVSTVSLRLRKYCPTIWLPLSRIRATPRAAKKVGVFYANANKEEVNTFKE